jgi:L-threonylcarbamoyladenylate synthase
MRVFNVDEIEVAAALLRAGGVLAYPTEAVYGLGCDPDNHAAFARIFAMKRRPPEQGVLLIAADMQQIEPWIGDAPAAALERARAAWPGAHTFIFPRSPRVPEWVAGGHAGIALRVTAHAPSAALCRTFGGPIVSTSANRHGQPPAMSAVDIRAAFGDEADGVLDAPLGGRDQPTPITDAVSGAIIRA